MRPQVARPLLVAAYAAPTIEGQCRCPSSGTQWMASAREAKVRTPAHELARLYNALVRRPGHMCWRATCALILRRVGAVDGVSQSANRWPVPVE